MAKRKFGFNEDDIMDPIDKTEEQTVDTHEEQEATNTNEENTADETSAEASSEEPEVNTEALNNVVEYHYNDMELEMFAASNASVKNLPAKEGEKIGKLEAGESVKVTGQCAETEYYRIVFNNSEGYVSKSSLVNNKKEDKKEEVEEPQVEEDKPIVIEFEFSRTRRKEKKDRRTMVLITNSTKEAVDKLLEEKYQESFNELVNELLDRWVEAHKTTK